MVVEPRSHESFEVVMGIDMQGLEPVHHAEGADESDESEAVVPVEVRDEDVIEPCRAQSHSAERYLRSFATVDEERLVAQFDDL